MRRRWIYAFTALALAAGMCFARPLTGGAAEQIDLTKNCSLTVHPDNGSFGTDLTGLELVVDLYRVAQAEPTEGYDTYGYQFTEKYQSLSVGEEPDAGEWRALAQKAADIALKDGSMDTPERRGAPADSPISGLKAGLYLMVVRGEDVPDYVLREEQKDGERIATIARSARYTYSFEPELISLPMKAADPLTGAVNTANTGDWLYDVEAELKVERTLRYGSLEIVKTLLTYETKEPATFVFEIEATLDGETVYSDVESITFTEAGQRRALLENRIPAGAEVVVREVYSGSAYRRVSEETQTAVIAADSMVSAAFTNDYDEQQRGGHGIMNQFTFDEGAKRWDWNSTPGGEPVEE